MDSVTPAPTVAALYVDANGPYSRLPGVDLWPIERDARNYCGPHPVVAHPPCARWGRYATWYGNTVGDDSGCGVCAIASVRRWGGILEHPAGSKLFKMLRLPKPGQVDDFGGRTIRIEQVDWGHRSLKPTWLYLCGDLELPPSPVRRGPIRPVEHLSKRQRMLTPAPLAAALVEAARSLVREAV